MLIYDRGELMKNLPKRDQNNKRHSFAYPQLNSI